MKPWSAHKIKLIVCITVSVVLLPLAASPFKEAKCAYIILLMSVFWMLEPVHLTITALLPVLLMPLFGILSASQVCGDYMKEVLMMFLGGLAVAVAVEHCNLHERIALKVLMAVGSDTKWLMFGFMSTTMFLSMWISNTATTAMMVPIVEAVMLELKSSLECDDVAPIKTESKVTHEVLRSALLLSVAYSANCGGTGTITGTSPNMILKGFLEETHPESSEITYASWMLYNVPGMIICVFIGWTILQLLYVPCWFHEGAVFFLFIVLVFLWIFREPKFMTGWAEHLASDTRIGDAVPVIGILFFLFFLPAEPWQPHISPPLLVWSAVQKKLPWGLVLLLGGGYALAHGTQESGLSKWLGDQMIQLSFLSPLTVLVILCVCTTVLTEVISNSTVTTILLPVVNEMAVAFRIHPLYLMLPVTISSSYAFMLPVAGGPNAIVFETGHMKTVEMIKPGIIMNIMCCIIQILMINSIGSFVFNLDTFPDWAAKNTFQNNTFNGSFSIT
ncbi:solute carrier family 13 member 5-like isoform X2 [Stegodyphus dumicola]|uniref:solute carrier family 13 member 5-like isoform X2 n=1 Tax=Stegodyphus dumicola TaxID=202533 RepID=UPI0015AFC68B|nr:solute carrier family 13 member 5-like isoform X2 [Stegodyphus dumicola]